MEIWDLAPKIETRTSAAWVVSALMADSGLLGALSFISPFRAERSRVRVLHEAAGLPFLEIFVDVPLDVAESPGSEREKPVPKGSIR